MHTAYCILRPKCIVHHENIVYSPVFFLIIDLQTCVKALKYEQHKHLTDGRAALLVYKCGTMLLVCSVIKPVIRQYTYFQNYATFVVGTWKAFLVFWLPSIKLRTVCFSKKPKMILKFQPFEYYRKKDKFASFQNLQSKDFTRGSRFHIWLTAAKTQICTWLAVFQYHYEIHRIHRKHSQPARNVIPFFQNYATGAAHDSSRFLSKMWRNKWDQWWKRVTTICFFQLVKLFLLRDNCDRATSFSNLPRSTVAWQVEGYFFCLCFNDFRYSRWTDWLHFLHKACSVAIYKFIM